jgi:hypothetical protein
LVQGAVDLLDRLPGVAVGLDAQVGDADFVGHFGRHFADVEAGRRGGEAGELHRQAAPSESSFEALMSNL